MSKKTQLPINRVYFCVATEINHQMLSSVSKDKFTITLDDNFIRLNNSILIPLTNIASIHFDQH